MRTPRSSAQSAGSSPLSSLTVRRGSERYRHREESVTAFEVVAEQASKFLERNLVIRHGEYDGVAIAGTNTTSPLARSAVMNEAGVQSAIYHQHWSGLRRQVRSQVLLEVRSCFEHPEASPATKNTPFGFKWKLPAPDLVLTCTSSRPFSM